MPSYLKPIFDTYIDNAFGQREQSDLKLAQFEFNYRKHFPPDKGCRLLDIGIGRGEMLACMKKWGYRNYLGIDVSPSTVEFCKSIELNCQVVHDSQEYLTQHKDTFSLITLLDVLEHIPKQHTIDFLGAIRNSLIRNGTLIIQVPNLQAPDGQLHRYNDFTHEVGYIEHSLQQVLMVAGFRRFCFHGFEELVLGGWKENIHRFLRTIYWACVGFSRLVGHNLNPAILHPVFFAVVIND